MDISEIADKAADIILEKGWQKGRMWGTHDEVMAATEMTDLPYYGGPVCLIGAVAIAREVDSTGMENAAVTMREDSVVDAVTLHLNQAPHVFNDYFAQDVEEVVTVLRDVAIKYRSDEMKVTNNG